MSYKSFWHLHNKLKGNIDRFVYEVQRRVDPRHKLLNVLSRNLHNRKSRNPPIPNGKISSSTRLACALRYFAGGSAYDLMGMYGIAHSEIFTSVWAVVQAVNRTPEFHITYPSDFNKQLKIAAEFKAVSGVGCVAGG
jgi:hypothetical protein